MRAVKTAVSLPEETFKRAEILRRRMKRSRSALYAEALREFFKAAEVREKEARYAAGYLERPEDEDAIAGALKAGVEVLPKEDW